MPVKWAECFPFRDFSVANTNCDKKLCRRTDRDKTQIVSQIQANERCAANTNCDKKLFRQSDGDELRVMRTSGRPSDTSHSNRKTALTITYLSGICQKFSQCSIAPFRSVINISQGSASRAKVLESANHIYRLRQHFVR